MSKRPRRNHSAAFKVKVAIEALVAGKTIAEIAQKHNVHPSQVTLWRRQLIERAAGRARGTTGRPQGAARQDRATDATREGWPVGSPPNRVSGGPSVDSPCETSRLCAGWSRLNTTSAGKGCSS
jgi:transposase-like protein